MSLRTPALLTTCVMLVWLSRVPAVFFDLAIFSYAVYASVALSLIVLFLRLVEKRGTAVFLRIITNKWLWLYVAIIIAGGLNGVTKIGDIPAWVLSGSDVDFTQPWVYLRTVVLPSVLLPALTVTTALAIADRQRPGAAMMPAWVFAAAMSLLVVLQILLSGESLGTMADAAHRSEHLVTLGFHSNELGTLLAIAYALILGARSGMEPAQLRTVMLVVLCAVGGALILTFSRGALLAFLVVNALFFLRGSPRKRAFFVTILLVALIAAPAAVMQRAQFGLDTGDLNEISAGRLDDIWRPLLPDISAHLLFGQGLYAILWTNAQRLQQIYPVMLSHNAYLDMVLDLGIVGSVGILSWYVYLWLGFRRGAATDPDPQFRSLFNGGQLALIALFLCALSNDRLTPTAPACLVWLVAGVFLGRRAMLDGLRVRVPAPQRPRPVEPRLVRATPLAAVHSQGDA